MRGVEEGHVPLSKHFECDIEVGGQLVHHMGILVKKDKIPLVNSKGRKAKTPALLSSNLIRIESDDPSKDNDGNSHDNQPLRPKHSQEHCKNSNEAKSDKDPGKSKNTQTGSGKQRNKKLNTLGGYAGLVMVGDC